MMERLEVGHFRSAPGAVLPLKSPSKHLGIRQRNNTAVGIKKKRAQM